MLSLNFMFFIMEPQTDLSTYSSEFFAGFYEHVVESTICTLHVHTMKTTHVTFRVTSLDDNFSYMGNTSYYNPHKITIYTSKLRGIRSYLFLEEKGS